MLVGAVELGVKCAEPGLSGGAVPGAQAGVAVFSFICKSSYVLGQTKRLLALHYAGEPKGAFPLGCPGAAEKVCTLVCTHLFFRVCTSGELPCCTLRWCIVCVHVCVLSLLGAPTSTN